MKAIDVLMEEHRVIERVLDSLEAGAKRLARGEPIRPGFFLDVADFATRFADGCHHQKEEGVLFPAMTEHGAPARGGAIEMMLHEHDAGRGYVRQLRDAARQLEAGQTAAVRSLLAAATGYAALLRDHIAKEDEVLFPTAAEMIPESEYAEVMEKFEHVEHDDAGPHAHADLLELAHRLQEEVSI
jgi:hemerythrin-like domain-containing protein